MTSLFDDLLTEEQIRDVVALLIERGANVNAHTLIGPTPESTRTPGPAGSR